jgi:hypothetical protein
VLDLSNNRLDGTLSSDFEVSAYQTTPGLAVNRLSGDLPNSIIEASSNMSSLNVLSGNIFACNNDDLPSQDPSVDSHSCSSYELYVPSYTWLGFVGSFMLFIMIGRMVIYRHQEIVTSFVDYLRLVSWSAAVSKFLDEFKDQRVFSASGGISRFQHLRDTGNFFY